MDPSRKARHQLITHMFSALDSPTHFLTRREEVILERIHDAFITRGFLSHRQAVQLDKIYSEKTEDHHHAYITP